MLRDPKVLICYVFVIAGCLMIDKWLFWDLPVWFFGAAKVLAFYKITGMSLITLIISVVLAACIGDRDRAMTIALYRIDDLEDFAE